MNIKHIPYIVFLTGASGAGKTAIVNELEKQNTNQKVAFLHFDSIGVPSEEEMIKEFGSGTAWQEQATYRWIKIITSEYSHKKIVIFEGQTNIDFIKGAFQAYKVKDYKILLINCKDETRHKRLAVARNQPHLINHDMDNWSDFLFKQATKYHIPIIDTSPSSLKEVISNVKNHITLNY